MRELITVIFKIPSKDFSKELEIPMDMPANELCAALYKTYFTDIDEKDLYHCYLKCENPIALLKGKKTVEEFGLYDGTVIICDR